MCHSTNAPAIMAGQEQAAPSLTVQLSINVPGKESALPATCAAVLRGF